MKTGLSQHTSLRQELRVNPRLYQAMDMLYMPMMDLQQHLKQELLSNPFLELLEPEEETPEQKDAEQEKEQKEKEEEMDWEEILLNGFEVGGTREQFEQLEYTEPVTVETKDLIDHLREQLQMLTLTPRQLLLAEEFLGNINEEGYLAASLEEIRHSVNQLVAAHVKGEGEGEGEGRRARRRRASRGRRAGRAARRGGRRGRCAPGSGRGPPVAPILLDGRDRGDGRRDPEA
jgi:RNA polymerase sigma-54 factor